MVKKTKDENEEPVEGFGDPDELMPIPDRLRQEPEEPREALESPVRSPAPETRALPVKLVSGIVEPDSVIRARKDAHLRKSRR